MVDFLLDDSEANSDWTKHEFDILELELNARPATGELKAVSNREELELQLKNVKFGSIAKYKRTKSYSNIIDALDRGALDEEQFGWLRDI